MKKILFITGTRADYGKIKSILKALEGSNQFSPYIYVCGMHLIDKFGSTYKEIIKDNYKHVILGEPSMVTNNMAQNVSNLISKLNELLTTIKIDMIVVHGDRTDALAGAIVGSLNNIRVGHIEGGEISGTIDESMRHAISKLANYHFVSNKSAKTRLIQMGESKESISIIGSPDFDLMLSNDLPSLENAKKRYGIDFDKYAILLFHPITTEFNFLEKYVTNVINAVIKSGLNYIVIYPNNDLGSDIIINNYLSKLNNKRFKLFPSIRFEFFLTFLKHSNFIIGNSSCGIRESGVYGVRSIDIGTRQSGRLLDNVKYIYHTSYSCKEIRRAIDTVKNSKYKLSSEYIFGRGNSANKFISIISDSKFWSKDLQKSFIDID